MNRQHFCHSWKTIFKESLCTTLKHFAIIEHDIAAARITTLAVAYRHQNGTGTLSSSFIIINLFHISSKCSSGNNAILTLLYSVTMP
jgi:hypothetical protein